MDWNERWNGMEWNGMEWNEPMGRSSDTERAATQLHGATRCYMERMLCRLPVLAFQRHTSSRRGKKVGCNGSGMD